MEIIEKQSIKNLYLKEWKFWFKLSIGILVLFAVFYDYAFNMMTIGKSITVEPDENGIQRAFYTWGNGKILYIGDPNDIVATKDVDYGAYTLFYFSFFTIQSNLAVAISALVLAFMHPKEGLKKSTGFYLTLTIAVFITITSLIFNFMLMPTSWNVMTADGKPIEYTPVGAIGESSIVTTHKYTPIQWLTQELLHTICPIMFVVYTLFFFNNRKLITNKQFAKQMIWKILIYPIVYGIYQLVKNEILRSQGRFDRTIYPYFFFKIHDEKVLGMHGAIWFVIAILLIAGIAIGFGFLFNYISIKLSQRNQSDKKTKSVKKEEMVS